MSLSSILDYHNKRYKKFRSFLSQNFPKPLVKVQTPLLVARESENQRLIGTAFDYLLRFLLEKRYSSQVTSGKWVSEKALMHFHENRIYYSEEEIDPNTDNILDLHEERGMLNQSVQESFIHHKQIYSDFVAGKMVDEYAIVEACLFLSNLDYVYRNGPRVIRYFQLGQYAEADMEELRKLLHVCNLDFFQPQSRILLNPTFGLGSKLVRGADADLIVDDTLIDVKVTVNPLLTRHDYNQIVSYYLLYLTGGIDGVERMSINRIGIYFARHNYLWTIDIDQIGSKQTFERAIKILKAVH